MNKRTVFLCTMRKKTRGYDAGASCQAQAETTDSVLSTEYFPDELERFCDALERFYDTLNKAFQIVFTNPLYPKFLEQVDICMEDQMRTSAQSERLIDDLAISLQTLASYREKDVANGNVLKFIDALIAKNLYLGCFVDFISAIPYHAQLSVEYYSTYIEKQFSHIRAQIKRGAVTDQQAAMLGAIYSNEYAMIHFDHRDMAVALVELEHLFAQHNPSPLMLMGFCQCLFKVIEEGNPSAQIYNVDVLQILAYISYSDVDSFLPVLDSLLSLIPDAVNSQILERERLLTEFQTENIAKLFQYCLT